jgi:hypothetical protein
LLVVSILPGVHVSEGDYFPGIAPGSASKDHRTMLSFAASEYKRLASCLSVGGKEGELSRTRLLEKAAQLSVLARN